MGDATLTLTHANAVLGWLRQDVCLFTLFQCELESSTSTSFSYMSFDFCFRPAIILERDSWAHHHLTLEDILGLRVTADSSVRIWVYVSILPYFPRPLGQIKMGNWKMLFTRSAHWIYSYVPLCDLSSVTQVQGKGFRDRNGQLTGVSGHINEMRPVTLLLQIQRSY